jgi:uncharacterized Zn finger protein
MLCPTCGEYGDLVHICVKGTGKRVIACTECDSLWETDDQNKITADSATDVTSYLNAHGLPSSWEELAVLGRVER